MTSTELDTTATAGEIQAYLTPEDQWEELLSGADEATGAELVKGDAADKLVGIPFLITRVTFREGVQRKGVKYRDDYVSVEAMVAPQAVIDKRIKMGRLSPSEVYVIPGEHIVFNDGSTGVYRQVMQYLAAKGIVGLPDGGVLGEKGESVYDLPRSQWKSGATAGADGNLTADFHVRLFCPRGLRISEYSNEYAEDGKTRYIA